MYIVYVADAMVFSMTKFCLFEIYIALAVVYYQLKRLIDDVGSFL